MTNINSYESQVANTTEAELLKINFPAEFSEPQKWAITAIVRGEGMSAAAKSAGVHRMTLRRWIDEGGAFHRFLRQEQGKMLRNARRDTTPIADEAAKVVATAVRSGNFQAAMAVLKAMGVFEVAKEEAAAGQAAAAAAESSPAR